MDDGAMLFVGKLPPSCKDGDGVIKLRKLFEKYGEVTDFVFNGTHAFVHMATEGQAKECITYLNGHKIGNALILVAIATGATAATGRKLAEENRLKHKNSSGLDKTNYKSAPKAPPSAPKAPPKSILKKAPVFQEPVGFNKQTGSQIGQNNTPRQHAERFSPYNTPNTSDKYKQGNIQSHNKKDTNQNMSANKSYDPLAMLKSPPGGDPLAGFLSEVREAVGVNKSGRGRGGPDAYRSDREMQAPQRGQQSSSKPMGNDYDPLAMLKTAAVSRDKGPFGRNDYASERDQQDYSRGSRSVNDGRQNSDYNQYSRNNSGPSNDRRYQGDDYNERNYRDEYNQRNTRDDYNQRNPRDEYNQRNPRDEYNQRNPRDDHYQRNPRDDYNQRNPRDDYSQRNPREDYNPRNDYNERNQRDYDSYESYDSPFYPGSRDNYDRSTDMQRGPSRDNFRGTYDDVPSRNDPYAQSNDTFGIPRNTDNDRFSNEPPIRLAQPVSADGKIVPKYPKREIQNPKFGCGADKLPNKNDIMAFLSGNF